MTKGSSFQLKLINGKEKKVRWSVANKKIATVKNGKVKAKIISNDWNGGYHLYYG